MSSRVRVKPTRVPKELKEYVEGRVAYYNKIYPQHKDLIKRVSAPHWLISHFIDAKKRVYIKVGDIYYIEGTPVLSAKLYPVWLDNEEFDIMLKHEIDHQEKLQSSS